MKYVNTLERNTVKAFSRNSFISENECLSKIGLKPLIAKGFNPYVFPQSVDNFHQCAK